MSSAVNKQPVVGLFGTCGESTWREGFIARYNQEDIPFYNPQVAPGTWDPSMAAEEADHLAHDVVQVWPVTEDSYGTGSLVEQGYSIASSLRAPSPLPKFVVVKIDPEPAPHLNDSAARQESVRARKLALAHLRLNESPSVFQVGTMEDMLDTSVKLFNASTVLIDLVKSHNPAFQRFIQGRREADAFRLALQSGQLGKDVLDIAQGGGA